MGLTIGGSYLAARQGQKQAKKVPVTSKKVQKGTKTGSNKQVTAPTGKQTTAETGFLRQPWTKQSALAFLQRVNDSSQDGNRTVGEDLVNYQVAPASVQNFPGNSIFVFGNNKSGAGDGGVLLTKNVSQGTVTLIFGTGAGSTPVEKVIVDPTNYQILATSEINTNQDMWTYFGVKNSVAKDDEQADNSASEANADDQSDTSADEQNHDDQPDDSSVDQDQTDHDGDTSNSDSKQSKPSDTFQSAKNNEAHDD
ncbi:hypothetical protein M8332_02180 [Fructilactobacillus ixorae]|uniref:DUF4767 domain-containing protein n=1 Tax=Fructilactobacillus ixorae TaxID=1750535 RepID=A0ABY5C4H7_9LACO|nr:hypothetical protein [Fructilactobacillus ixorae]USS93680.1 hypothetical protein M8332_02180 [Fructilactobacillus ixorae]